MNFQSATRQIFSFTILPHRSLNVYACVCCWCCRYSRCWHNRYSQWSTKCGLFLCSHQESIDEIKVKRTKQKTHRCPNGWSVLATCWQTGKNATDADKSLNDSPSSLAFQARPMSLLWLKFGSAWSFGTTTVSSRALTPPRNIWKPKGGYCTQK